MRRACLGLLALAVLVYVALPLGDTAQAWMYEVIAAGSLAVGWCSLAARRPPRLRSWAALLGGYSLWVVGDLVYDFEQYVWHLDTSPAPSDAFYLLGYVVMGFGVLEFVRTRRLGRNLTALLDAGIVTVGVAVPAAVFLIVPATVDSSLSVLGKVVSSAYPLGDLFLLAVLARLMATPGSTTAAFRLLVGSLGATLVADVVYQAITTSGVIVESVWLDLGWLAGYVLVAMAAEHSSMRALGEQPPDREAAPTRRQLVLLTGASVLPGVTLLVDGLLGRGVAWAPVGVGIVLLAVLVLARMGQLLGQVQVQAVQLAALARVDALTGAPNRRTWDHELSRACRTALDRDEPLAIAILDVDHFKDFNDSRGHQAGDALLRAAVQAWTAALGAGQMLARYGGEEFAVLLPNHDLPAGRRVLDSLRSLTPSGQTFSAGVALWQPGTDPGSAVAAADAALYRAKRGGRDRVEVADDGSRDAEKTVMDGMRIVLQPIVDAATGEIVGHEALTRFAEDCDIRARFDEAHSCGFGDLLEAHAVGTAVALPGRPAGQRLFVNVSAGALLSSRFWDVLPERLDGVVVELVEDDRTVDWRLLSTPLGRLRDRGARLAVDDLGAGAGDLSRLLAIRPDVVKLDRDLVDGCADDPLRTQLMRMIVQLADAGGARVCAEGVEQQADLTALRGVGVHLAQGYLLGRPQPTWSDGVPLPAAPDAAEAPSPVPCA